MEKTIGLKEFRQNISEVALKTKRGQSFIVAKQSKPIFKIVPIIEEQWEEVVDFTKIRKGGVNIKDLLTRL
ncbi:MAG: type II toxin-antitoxin system prevent-host-death family antitoxin [bacterium]|nr:type II toxin-antitoxin system prevent-host-death family antitoxin [bacterium]